MFNLIETPKSWKVNLMLFLPKWIYQFNLVGISTPLKNLSESQLGWWNSQYMKKKSCSKPPISNHVFFDSNICGRAHFDPYRKNALLRSSASRQVAWLIAHTGVLGGNMGSLYDCWLVKSPVFTWFQVGKIWYAMENAACCNKFACPLGPF